MNTKERARALVNLHLLRQITKPTDKIAHTTHKCVHDIILNNEYKKC